MGKRLRTSVRLTPWGRTERAVRLRGDDDSVLNLTPICSPNFPCRRQRTRMPPAAPSYKSAYEGKVRTAGEHRLMPSRTTRFWWTHDHLPGKDRAIRTAAVRKAFEELRIARDSQAV